MYSKFCGESICEDHGRKRRPDPKNSSNYVRICDTCDEKFIQRTILKEFRAKLSEKEEHIKDLERRIRDQQGNIGNVQKDYDDLCLKVEQQKMYRVIDFLNRKQKMTKTTLIK